MSKGFLPSRLAGLAALLAVLIVCAAVFLFQPRGGVLDASAQLVSVQPLPDMDGAMCEWPPASAPQTLAMALQENAPGATSQNLAMDLPQNALATTTDMGRPTVELPGMMPVRTIHDPYSGFSSIFVDSKDNEVAMTDENLFQIVTYDRLTNTPLTEAMSEPKRAIGGLKTKIEYQCGIYVDPENGNIYGVNNDTQNTLVTFSRDQNGNVVPAKELHTPHGTFGISVDETAREMYLTVEHDSAVVVYPKDATGEDSPIRLLQGDKTLLADPHGLAVDTKDQLLFVANIGSTHSVQPGEGRGRGEGAGKQNWPLDRGHGIPGSGRNLPPSITVYALKASGDAAPLRVITGPHTEMDWPTGLVVDPERGELYVSNDETNSIAVFDINANGDVAPKRTLKGPKTWLRNPTGLYLDLQHDELWSANFGNHTATAYPRAAAGDVRPLRVIRSGPPSAPAPMMGNPQPIAFDTKRQELLVPN